MNSTNINTGHGEFERQLSVLQKENAELYRIIELHHQGDKVIEAERQIFRTRISELERIVKVKDGALVLVLDHPVVTAEELFQCRQALALQPEK